MYVVYKHTAPNGKAYIGITRQNPVKRWGGGANYVHNEHFYNAILKYGWDNIKHEILYADLTKEEAEQKEIELIALYKSDNREYGYNIEHGGNAIGKFSEESRAKLSKALKGRTAWNKGISTVPWNKGIQVSDEEKKRLGELRKGKPSSFKGKHHSEETKKILSEAHKGKMTGGNHPRAKKVLCIETNTIYNTLAEAARETNISNVCICHCCKGTTKSAGGFHWKYVI